MTQPNPPKVALITGGSKRIGRQITKTLHEQGYDVIVHYHQSEVHAQILADELNRIRPNSAKLIKANLSIINDKDELGHFTRQAMGLFGQVDLLIHNASSFYPSPLSDDFDKWQSDWEDLFLTNAKAPLFLSHAFQAELIKNHGAMVSLLDIHARDKPFLGHPIYTMAKSAHLAMVQSLALELAPQVRVNGVAVGVNIFPDTPHDSLNVDTQQILTDSVPLGRIGTPFDVAQAVVFLATAPYITGQILAVDGGRSLTLKGG